MVFLIQIVNPGTQVVPLDQGMIGHLSQISFITGSLWYTDDLSVFGAPADPLYAATFPTAIQSGTNLPQSQVRTFKIKRFPLGRFVDRKAGSFQRIDTVLSQPVITQTVRMSNGIILTVSFAQIQTFGSVNTFRLVLPVDKVMIPVVGGIPDLVTQIAGTFRLTSGMEVLPVLDTRITFWDQNPQETSYR